jgi:hypothetical protein
LEKEQQGTLAALAFFRHAIAVLLTFALHVVPIALARSIQNLTFDFAALPAPMDSCHIVVQSPQVNLQNSLQKTLRENENSSVRVFHGI